MFDFQRTINNTIKFSGLGLHTGKKSTMLVHPASENSGIIFKRNDLENDVVIKAEINNVVETNRGTTIGNKGHLVYTVEHFLSAVNGLGIDNAYIVDRYNIPRPIHTYIHTYIHTEHTKHREYTYA